MHRLRLGLVSLALVVVVCGPPTTEQSANPATAPVQQESPPIVSGEAIAEASAFRQRYGLRSDQAWVKAVAAAAAAPMSVPEFGVPLTQAEFDELMSRRWDPDLFAQVRGYGLLFPDDFAGARINLEADGAIIYFKNRVGRHRVALSNLVPPGAAVEVREVEWSLDDLHSFIDRVVAEEAWLDSVGVRVKAGENIRDNAVHARFRGPRDAAVLIEAHFDNPSWLKAEWTGALPWEGPRADLTITVSDAVGQPLRNVRCRYTPVDPTVYAPDDFAFVTNAAGVCALEKMPVALFDIGLHGPAAGGNHDAEPMKTLRIAVRPGGTTTNVVVEVP